MRKYKKVAPIIRELRKYRDQPPTQSYVVPRRSEDRDQRSDSENEC